MSVIWSAGKRPFSQMLSATDYIYLHPVLQVLFLKAILLTEAGFEKATLHWQSLQMAFIQMVIH